MRRTERPSTRKLLYVARVHANAILAIEMALRDMEATMRELQRHVAYEEARTRTTDVKDCTYSTTATAARIRYNNLEKSVIGLRAQLCLAAADYHRTLAQLPALARARARRARSPYHALPVSRAAADTVALAPHPFAARETESAGHPTLSAQQIGRQGEKYRHALG
jgi:hypothetical protein